MIKISPSIRLNAYGGSDTSRLEDRRSILAVSQLQQTRSLDYIFYRLGIPLVVIVVFFRRSRPKWPRRTYQSLAAQISALEGALASLSARVGSQALESRITSSTEVESSDLSRSPSVVEGAVVASILLQQYQSTPQAYSGWLFIVLPVLLVVKKKLDFWKFNSTTTFLEVVYSFSLIRLPLKRQSLQPLTIFSGNPGIQRVCLRVIVLYTSLPSLQLESNSTLTVPIPCGVTVPPLVRTRPSFSSFRRLVKRRLSLQMYTIDPVSKSHCVLWRVVEQLQPISSKTSSSSSLGSSSVVVLLKIVPVSRLQPIVKAPAIASSSELSAAELSAASGSIALKDSSLWLDFQPLFDSLFFESFCLRGFLGSVVESFLGSLGSLPESLQFFLPLQGLER